MSRLVDCSHHVTEPLGLHDGAVQHPDEALGGGDEQLAPVNEAHLGNTPGAGC